MQRMAQRLGTGIGLAALFVTLSCDLGSVSAPTTACVEAATQCQLPDGPLGVCERTSCAPGKQPPCFQCVPQH